MGKRSDFERVGRDFYPTPMAAVEPLVPFLAPGWFAEPCIGDGRLADHIEELTDGKTVLGFGSDLEPQCPHGVKKSFEDVTIEDVGHCDWIITNPPWDRKVLHPMIAHFVSLKPTWLLFDADWAHTKQSVPFMPMLRKIVSVGRVKWIADSKMTGKDNCAWYLFDANGSGPAVFHGRGGMGR